MINKNEALEFTNDWFDQTAKATWSKLIPQLKPSKILEIGSFEGRGTCWLIENMNRAVGSEIHCIDTWEGGVEHKSGNARVADMQAVEDRFIRNTQKQIEKFSPGPALKVHKGESARELPKLIVDGGENFFDLIYIDGSHQSADVLLDGVLSFKLLRIGGVLIFDDYLWEAGPNADILMTPKLGIDCFVNTHRNKIRVLIAPLYQIYVQKIAD